MDCGAFYEVREVPQVLLDEGGELLKLAQPPLSVREHREPRFEALALFANGVELLAELRQSD